MSTSAKSNPMEPTLNPMDIVAPKLTITPIRFEIKMPTRYEAAYATRVVAFAKSVAVRLGVPTQSLRGTVKVIHDHRLFVQLHKNSKDPAGSFTEGEDASN